MTQNLVKIVTKADEIIEACKDVSVIILDTETSSLRPWTNGKILAGLGIKPLDGEMFYLSFRHKDTRNASLIELKKFFDWFFSLVRRRRPVLVFHNPKFDMAVLYQDGVDLSDDDITIYDTATMVRLVSEDEFSYELKVLGDKYYPLEEGEKHFKDVEKDLKDYMRKNACFEIDADGEKQFRYDWVPAPLIANPYVKNDLLLTEFFYKRCIETIEKRDLEELLAMEEQLTHTLFNMERYGALVDMDFITKEKKAVEKLIAELKKECHILAENSLSKLKTEGAEKALTELLSLPNDFQTSSPHFIKRMLEGMGLESPIKTKKGGKSSWNKIALTTMEHPIAETIVKCRAATNILNYYKTFIDFRDGDDIIHPNFYQSGTKSGRLSCREPNLQNIPAMNVGFTGSRAGAQVSAEKLRQRIEQEEKAENERKEKKARYTAIGRAQIGVDEEVQEAITSAFEARLFGKVRGAFIPRPDSILISVDWQNVELRIFADYAGEKEMMEAFRLGLDIHRLTARAAFGIIPDEKENPELFKWVRSMGKQIAFGLLYGMGVKLLSAEIGKPESEAKKFMSNFFGRFVNAKTFIRLVGKRLEAVGYLKDKWGRRRYINADRAFTGPNFLVQGTAADLMKDALNRVERMLRKYESKCVITVHDEIIFNIPYHEIEEVIPLIVREMETCEKLTCVLKCDVEWSKERWSEIKSISCDTCDGKGLTTEMSKYELIEALYENDKEKIARAVVETCSDCNGVGYKLEKIKI